jgi:hypothetical protein
MRRGAKIFVLVKRELVRKRTTLLYISYAALYSSNLSYIVIKALTAIAKLFFIVY